MAFKFESLQIWTIALDLTVEISDLAKTFPQFELYSLSSQIRRASDSVVLNIAEGCTGQTNPEFKKFLGYALRSSVEVVSCLFIAKKKNYLSQANFNKYYTAYEILCKKISSLKASIST
jgi:four helix bundle protein